MQYKIRHRTTLVVLALGIQLPILAGAWAVTFRNVRGELASAVEQYIVKENENIVQSVVDRFPRDIGVPEFQSEEWEAYQEVIESAGADLVAGGFACLLDPRGNILCHPDIREDAGLRRVNLNTLELDDKLRHGQSIRLGDADAGATFSGEVNFIRDGVHYVATTTVPGTDLRVLVHQPEAKLLAASRSISMTVVGSGAIAILIVVFISGTALLLLIRRYDGIFESLTRRLKGDLEIAREIQQSTFPTLLPIARGYEIVAWSKPAEETGGDTFDVIGLPVSGEDQSPAGVGAEDAAGEPEQVLFMLADATGHGIGPALAATGIRAMLRMGVRMRGELDAIIHHLNEQLTADLPDGRFVTGWLGLLDTASGTVRSFSAGQAPIYVYRAADGAIESLDADDVPFGIPGPA